VVVDEAVGPSEEEVEETAEEATAPEAPAEEKEKYVWE